MSLVDFAKTDTLPKLLQRNAEENPNAAGIREKTRGVWQTFSWSGYRDMVRDFALGLAAQGFKRGDKLSVVGDNRPQLYAAQLSAQALGGMAVPVYQDSIASELVYVLNHAEVSVIVAEDQEQVDKVLSLKEQLPHLRQVIFDDPRGLWAYDDAVLTSFEKVIEAGRAFGKEHPDYFAAEMARMPDPVPISRNDFGVSTERQRTISPRQNEVVGCWPVPKLRPGSRITTAWFFSGRSLLQLGFTSSSRPILSG